MSKVTQLFKRQLGYQPVTQSFMLFPHHAISSEMMRVLQNAIRLEVNPLFYYNKVNILLSGFTGF